MILLTGLSSETGLRVAKRLVKSGHDFTALVKDPDDYSDLKSKKTTLIKGSLTKPDTVKKALKDVENAFLLPPLNQKQIEIEKSFIDTAKKEGVEHVVKYSAIGADPDSPSSILRSHGLSEEYLKDSGLRYTIVRPNIFMQNFVEYYGDQIKKKKEFRLPLRDAKCGYLDIRDLARLISKTLTSNGGKNKTYTATGPESLSCEEVAELISEATGRKIKYTDIKLKEFRKDMMDTGMNEEFAEAYTEVFRIVRDGAHDVVTDDIYSVTDRQPHTFEEFLDDNVKFFLKK